MCDFTRIQNWFRERGRETLLPQSPDTPPNHIKAKGEYLFHNIKRGMYQSPSNNYPTKTKLSDSVGFCFGLFEWINTKIKIRK